MNRILCRGQEGFVSLPFPGEIWNEKNLAIPKMSTKNIFAGVGWVKSIMENSQ